MVRSIRASISLSIIELKELALAAAKEPPTKVIIVMESDGQPVEARKRVGTVVTRRSSMMRGLVSAR